MWAYRVVRRFLSFVVHVFFRQIEVVGLENIPGEDEGPVIFAGNHPNSLIDPVMVVATSGRIVHFAAADYLFRSRLLRPILLALGAVPIRRRMDHGDGKVDNSAAFDALYEVLRSGNTVGIFPEGLSHNQSQLAQLKTGAARLAFGVMERHPDLPLCIVPFGLTFDHRRHFRSRVLVQYGPPIIIDQARLEEHAGAEREAVQQLTDDIDQGMREVTINAASWETLRVLDGVRRLYQPGRVPLQHRVELARRFALVYEHVREDPKVMQLYGRVADYMDRLSDLGLTDAELKRPVRLGQLFFKLLARGGRSLFWLPLALPGMVIHAPMGLLVSWSGKRFTPRQDVITTTKLLVGMVLVGLVYLALMTSAFLLWGWPWAVALGVLLPLSGHATIRVLERTFSIKRVMASFARAMVLKREIRDLRGLRTELEVEVMRMVDVHRPEGMVPLYVRTEDIV